MKSKEWIIATKLELTHSKKEIITMYANTVDFGSNAFGIKTAAKTYFNTSPKELTTEQAAVRYCFDNCPDNPPVYNGEGLPAIPFAVLL